MKDVQNERPENQRSINQVGVKGVRYPIVVMDKNRGRQHTVAVINMYVSLPKDYRGTHMSRFLEILNEYHGRMSRPVVMDLLTKMKERLNAAAAHLELSFPYFIRKHAPVSEEGSLMSYQCRWIASEDHDNKLTQLLEVRVPVMNLCPCSKEISATAAHNQRGEVLIRIESDHLHWIEDMVALVESCASAPLFSLLKREDEKYISELAYDNPRFVEDIVRQVADKIEALQGIKGYVVEAENFESIHNHNAFAMIHG
ncbi:GTP cyclohydrolase I FolE2 [bacterium]|nr:GTP cyclohydrolase I FolE2 [candidate division CSSED10-310 bacterium]